MISAANRLAAKSSSELSAPWPNRLKPATEPLGDVVEGDPHENQETPENEAVKKAGDRPLGYDRGLQEHAIGHFPQAPQRAIEAGDFLPAGDQAVFPEEFFKCQAQGQCDGGDKKDFLDDRKHGGLLVSACYVSWSPWFSGGGGRHGHSSFSQEKSGKNGLSRSRWPARVLLSLPPMRNFTFLISRKL